MTPGRGRRTFLRGLVAGAACALGLVALVDATDFYELLAGPLWRADTPGRADAIVVLGGGIVEFCEPNASSLERTRIGVRLLRAGRAPRLVCSGGRPEDSPDCSIAEVMARLARELGAPAGAIQLEAESHSTFENAARCAELLRGSGARRVLVVTDALHMRRAEACFRHFGFDVERASVPQPWVSPSGLLATRYVLREWAALAYYRVRGRLSPGAAVAPSAPVPVRTRQEGAP